MLGMTITEKNESPTNTTTSTSFLRAHFCVLHNMLHLGTAQVLAVDLTAAGGMHQALYLLLSELEFEMPTEWHNAFPFQTIFGMIKTKMN